MLEFDVSAVILDCFAPLFAAVRRILLGTVGGAVGLVVLFFAVFFLRYKLRPWALDPDKLAALEIPFKYHNLLRWLLWDFITRKSRSLFFRPYGFTIFVGKQGAGKTISMIQYLNDMKQRYPNCLIVTNFKYTQADHQMKDWRDLMTIRNGEEGVIFAIDEIHSEYSSEAWKDFPESLLSEISQQRKQKVKIVATAQVYSRVAKPIREQCFSVIVCNTVLGRYTTNHEYDAAEYSTSDTPYQVKKKCKPFWKSRFVQSNELRECYDTYEKIERMKKIDFIPRGERGR